MLNSIFESYARVINSRINALLHATCEIDVDSVEEQRYYEFSNALTESDVQPYCSLILESASAPAGAVPGRLQSSPVV